MFFRNLLRTNMFFYRFGIIGTAFDCGIIGDNHTMISMDQTNTRHDPSTMNPTAILTVGR